MPRRRITDSTASIAAPCRARSSSAMTCALRPPEMTAAAAAIAAAAGRSCSIPLATPTPFATAVPRPMRE
eukprot:CAMPEP_0206146408 /NCGR_PEP_ID=MMETSP1473-20131121/30232_1 /ASSEMBLY_ACC=CAM_ASM_001109 /TAXON_ID=1461547 /ORGANISM="Stichococcus sp, Strain RCC1054" /LENGTH=69 /DNA_ID=CAMNT_0053542945 /DNA_START=111 /DNA_END=320 /DNA_ORIENTATION=+